MSELCVDLCNIIMKRLMKLCNKHSVETKLESIQQISTPPKNFKTKSGIFTRMTLASLKKKNSDKKLRNIMPDIKNNSDKFYLPCQK